jgi:EAL domain-containing protein (putative c-di-GMP-specific phosphodiesterase class I)
MGCHVALDDFGAGHSSFRQLKALAVDLLKIDGSFVRGVAESRDNQLLVRTLLDLARGFSLETVAEWVESTDDARFLVDQGVDYLQGYLLGAPVLDRSWTFGDKANPMPVVAIPGLSPQHRVLARLAHEVGDREASGF